MLQTLWYWFGEHLQEITLITTLLTLVTLWRTMKAAERQSEGSFKPFLTLKRQHTQPLEDDETELLVNPVVPFEIVNVGTGPALMVKWKFRRASGDEIPKGKGESVPHSTWARGENPLARRRDPGSGKGVFPIVLECTYLSASDVKYRSTTQVEKPGDLIIAKVHVERIRTKWLSRD